MLTKERIEAIDVGGNDTEWEVAGNVGIDEMREVIRLAKLGLETEERRARVDAGIEAEMHVESSVLADSFGAFPDLDPVPKRDERAERVGRAVITWVGDDTPAQLRTYASDLEADQWPVGADLIRDIADAMEEP